MESIYNLRNPAVKRLMREAEELKNATEEYFAQPVEDNLFEWHFTVRGPPKSDFDGGYYHGRITLPPDYPMKPPSIILLTPNGRFEVNKKICLSISGHHPESWQPSWSIRTALVAMIGFMPTHGNGAIGSLDYSSEERRQLALKSHCWKCPDCGPVIDLLLKPVPSPDQEHDLQRPAEECEKSESSGELFCTVPQKCEVSQSNVGSSEHMQSSLSHQGCHTSPHVSGSEGELIQRMNVPRNDQTRNSDADASSETSEHVSSYSPRSSTYSLVFMWTIVLLILVLLIRRLMFI